MDQRALFREAWEKELKARAEFAAMCAEGTFREGHTDVLSWDYTPAPCTGEIRLFDGGALYGDRAHPCKLRVMAVVGESDRGLIIVPFSELTVPEGDAETVLPDRKGTMRVVQTWNWREVPESVAAMSKVIGELTEQEINLIYDDLIWQETSAMYRAAEKEALIAVNRFPPEKEVKK